MVPGSLADIRLLAGMADAEIGELERQCLWSTCKAGDQIIGHETEGCDAYFIVDGEVRVLSHSSTGREVAFANIGAGGYFGELAAIDRRARSANVVAVQDCLLAAVSPNVFMALVRSHSEIAVRVLQKMVNIVRISDERIMDLSTRGAVERIYSELLRLAEPDAANPAILSVWPLPTQQDMAANASTTRETVARVLSQLTKDGIIERKNRAMYIRDSSRLSDLAMGEAETNGSGGAQK